MTSYWKFDLNESGNNFRVDLKNLIDLVVAINSFYFFSKRQLLYMAVNHYMAVLGQEYFLFSFNWPKKIMYSFSSVLLAIIVQE